jgi:hypothetical protein
MCIAPSMWDSVHSPNAPEAEGVERHARGEARDEQLGRGGRGVLASVLDRLVDADYMPPDVDVYLSPPRCSTRIGGISAGSTGVGSTGVVLGVSVMA